MKGHVPTPDALADEIVSKLFDDMVPESGDRILYPGMGTGPFVAAVERYCDAHDCPVPDGVGIELDPELISEATSRHGDRNLDILERDYLADVSDLGAFRFIVGNPPYVPIEDLDTAEKEQYKQQFETAVGRFDLYILFFERSLDLLDDGGRLSFITPEKFEYVETAFTLRELLSQFHIEEIDHVPEDSFEGFVTYPTITTIRNSKAGQTRITRRDGTTDTVQIPTDGDSWASLLRGGQTTLEETGVTLGDITTRVSCGLATGADSLFVMDEGDVPTQLTDWTFKTTSGKQLTQNKGPDSGTVLLCPYNERGTLVAQEDLGPYGDWAEIHRERLEDRYCVENGGVWYSWHENPPMDDILQPKILCPDIAEEPQFYLETDGDVVPRHTVYYIIPKDGVDLYDLHEYLNSFEAREWIKSHAQKAHNDYYRLQSKVLKKMPVPEDWGQTTQQTLI